MNTRTHTFQHHQAFCLKGLHTAVSISVKVPKDLVSTVFYLFLFLIIQFCNNSYKNKLYLKSGIQSEVVRLPVILNTLNLSESDTDLVIWKDVKNKTNKILYLFLYLF